MAGTEYAVAYETPISLDAGRLVGARPMRSTLWIFAAVIGSLPVLILAVMSVATSTVLATGNQSFADIVTLLLLIATGPTIVLWLVAMVLANDFGQRPAEYWLRVWARHRRLPTRLDGRAIVQHHSQLEDIPRGCVELIGTTNLRMADEETLSSAIKRLGVFFNGLRFPVQIVVRAWDSGEGLIERRWFIAFTSPTPEVLKSSSEAIVSGLSRAGLRGQELNGHLYDTLQRCWTTNARTEQLGPSVMHRAARNVIVDGEHVRGFVLARYPRITDANWLAPLLDGDLACDCSIWLDPTDNADELEYLAGRIVEWQTAQLLNTNSGVPANPDIDDQINDAKRTRTLVRRGELRVFKTTIGFVVRGKNVAEMTAREQLLRDQMREKVGNEALIPLDYEHDRAVLLAVPTGEPPVGYPLRTVTPAIARAYPFSNSSVHQVGGVDVGTSTGSKRPNRINPFIIANPHVLVLGTTGSGKGFWVKVFISRLLSATSEMNVYIIQAEKDEYTALVEALGPDRAQLVRITSLDELTDRWRLPPNWPTVVDRDGNRRPRVIGIHEALAPITWDNTGALKTFRSLQLYDLTGLPSAERGTAITFLLQAIERSAAARRPGSNGMVVIDELGIVLESDEAAMAIETAYRRFRSIPTIKDHREVNRLGMIGISQRPSDLLGHKRGKVLADLALTHVYFRQKSTELRRVARELNLSPDEERFLDEQCDEGTGLLVADRARVGFHLDVSPAEYHFART